VVGGGWCVLAGDHRSPASWLISKLAFVEGEEEIVEIITGEQFNLFTPIIGQKFNQFKKDPKDPKKENPLNFKETKKTKKDPKDPQKGNRENNKTTKIGETIKKQVVLVGRPGLVISRQNYNLSALSPLKITLNFPHLTAFNT
jgi:hypothetical protein